DPSLRPSIPADSVHLIVEPFEPDPLPPPRPIATVSGDWTFSVVSRFDRGLIRAASLPTGWGVKAVRLNGRDVTDSGVAFAAGATADGLEVELTNRLSKISGVVRNADGRVVDDCTVVIFARDREKRLGASRFYAIARPDQEGSFLVNALPAAEYLAIALE